MDKKEQTLAPWNWLQHLFREEQIFPFITTCAIEATIGFDSNGQVDSTQVFHTALFGDGRMLRNFLLCGNFWRGAADAPPAGRGNVGSQHHIFAEMFRRAAPTVESAQQKRSVGYVAFYAKN